MRFMVMVMARKESEAGPPPKPEQFAAMQQYNEEPALVKRAPSIFETRSPGL